MAGEGEVVRASYTLTVSDVRRAATSLSHYSIVTNALGFALVGSGLFSLLANGSLFGIVIALLGALFLSGDAAGLSTGLMVGRRPDLLRQPVTLVVSPASIQTEMASMRGEAAWSNYKRGRFTGGALVLELGTGPAVIIPTRAFDDDALDRVRGWAMAAGILDGSSPARAYAYGLVYGLGFNAAIFGLVVLSFNL